MKVACRYAIIRFLPFIETGEFANVGVVLLCPERRFFGSRLMEKRYGRVTQFFEGLEAATYREAIRHFDSDLRTFRSLLKHDGPLDGRRTLDAVRAESLFADLVRPRESILRFSEVRTTIADEPETRLRELFEFYVERNFVTKEYREQVLERGMRLALRSAELQDAFLKAEVGTHDFHVTLPFVHFVGDDAVMAFKPLTLAQAEASKIYDHGGHWVDRMLRLKRRQQMPWRMIFAVEGPETEEIDESQPLPMRRDRLMLNSGGGTDLMLVGKMVPGSWAVRLGDRAKAAQDIAQELTQLGAEVVPFADRQAIIEIARSASGQ